MAGHDAQFVAVMLRLIVRHGEFTAERARLLLATEYAPPSGSDGGS
ncbi:hypothetical protein [Streptomyces sp. CBMA29]|nr:hypothetical protein [Streptomyces sp. CBMA29]